MLHNTSAQVALSTPDDRHRALHETMAELLALDEPRRRTAAMLTGLDVHYDLGDGHPLLGRRMPDLDVETAEGPTRVYELLHDARPVLLDLGGAERRSTSARGPIASAWSTPTTTGTWELPVLGEVDAPAAVLIRPDGHVAWTGAPHRPRAPERALEVVRAGEMTSAPQHGDPEPSNQRRREAGVEQLGRGGEAHVAGVEVDAGRDDLVDAVEHVVGEHHVGAGQQVVELLGRAGSDDDRGDRRVGPHERGGQVGQREARLGGQHR